MEDIKVSIICTVFNHEKFLADCLNGFINQVVDFKYEVLINDDCSNDSSRKIIRSYQIKYPDIIKPVYQNENQFSKGVSISNDILLPLAKGKYIAICEGDDCWIDNNKLQRQFDFMEMNPGCTLCTHNTIIHDVSGNTKDRYFNRWDTIHKLSPEDVIMGWNVHISSYMFRKEYYNHQKDLPAVWCGDYARLLYAFACGDVISLPYTMSKYNINNTQGMTWKVRNPKLKYKRAVERKNFIMAFDLFTDYRYTDVLKKRIVICEYDTKIALFEEKMMVNPTKENYRTASRSLKRDPVYKNWRKDASARGRISQFLVLTFYCYFKKVYTL